LVADGGQGAVESVDESAPANYTKGGLQPTFSPMACLFAHITPLEAPVVWFAFAAGLLAGIVGTWTVLRTRAARRDA
jgi:Na+-driven multidrug efflux pump